MIKLLLQGTRHYLNRTGWLCAIGFLSCAAIADTPLSVLGRLNIPEGVDMQIVTSNSVSNGMPVAIATLRSVKSSDSVLSFYRDYWAIGKNNEEPGFVESGLPGWSLISRMHGGYNTVIQLDTGKQRGTSGLISVMAIDRPVQNENHGEFEDLKLLSSNRSVDGVDTSSMRVYGSSSSVSHTYQIYRQRLIRKRWQLMSENDVDDGRVMIFARDQSRLEVSIVESSEFGSVLVAHEVVSQ